MLVRENRKLQEVDNLKIEVNDVVCKGIQETKSHILLLFLCHLWKC